MKGTMVVPEVLQTVEGTVKHPAVMGHFCTTTNHATPDVSSTLGWVLPPKWGLTLDQVWGSVQPV